MSTRWTEPSLPAVVRLGERIVAELGLEESTDTLSRWMAHYIAESIARAGKGSRKDKRRPPI